MLRLSEVLATVFVLLIIVEYLWRVRHFQSEFTRKFLHITVGSFAAFWPWLLSWRQIELIAALLVFGVLAARSLTILSRIFTIFGSVHLIGRKTVGELFFSLSIGILAFMTHDRLIFMTALLHLSVADGLAAIVGTQYGSKASYSILGQRKTIIGSASFYACSLLLVSLYFLLSHHSGALPTILWLPVVATILENIGIRGSDNVLVPLVVAAVLRAV